MADGAVHIPNATPFAIITDSINDALVEAKNWADGTPAENQEQVDEIARLIDDLTANAKALEAERVTEKKPHDDAIKAIQDRFNVYLAPLTNKGVKGKVPLAIEALRAAQRPFLLKREAELEEQRRKAREEAEAKAREAAEAARQAAASDLAAREEVEAKERAAKEAERAAKDAEAARAHAHGEGRAQGLSTKRIAVITDLTAAVRHYWHENEDAFRALVQKLADDDARQNRKAAEGKGVTFKEERV